MIYNKNKYKYFYFLVISVLSFILLFSCNSNPLNPIQKPTNISANIAGAYNLFYHSPGGVTLSNQDSTVLQLQMAGVIDSSGFQYGFNVSIFYRDKIEKTGTFHFTNNNNSILTDYAEGACTFYHDGKQRGFISDSGTVIISVINGHIIKGTFSFFASEIGDTAHIQVTNGILDMN
ncbi:MAG: hypothetical protein ABSG15_03795 [FCB group bacterium]|jgi:hypothetical protein